MKKLSAYVKDTTDFQGKMKDIVDLQPNHLLCAMDVASLYTNIPHRDELNAFSYYLDQREDPCIPASFLLTLTELVLITNDFKFENQYNLQRMGVSMGGPFSQNFSNSFMGKFTTFIFKCVLYLDRYCR